jgi:hypothetical protein
VNPIPPAPFNPQPGASWEHGGRTYTIRRLRKTSTTLHRADGNAAVSLDGIGAREYVFVGETKVGWLDRSFWGEEWRYAFSGIRPAMKTPKVYTYRSWDAVQDAITQHVQTFFPELAESNMSKARKLIELAMPDSGPKVTHAQIREAVCEKWPQVFRAMDQALGSIPPEYRRDDSSAVLGTLTDEYHDELQVNYLQAESHMIFLLTPEDEARMDEPPGTSDNEAVIPYQGLKLLVVGI